MFQFEFIWSNLFSLKTRWHRLNIFNIFPKDTLKHFNKIPLIYLTASSPSAAVILVSFALNNSPLNTFRHTHTLQRDKNPSQTPHKKITMRKWIIYLLLTRTTEKSTHIDLFRSSPTANVNTECLISLSLSSTLPTNEIWSSAWEVFESIFERKKKFQTILHSKERNVSNGSDKYKYYSGFVCFVATLDCCMSVANDR